jgi:TRAP-type uncharacterized transport system substrate-binding protein
MAGHARRDILSPMKTTHRTVLLVVPLLLVGAAPASAETSIWISSGALGGTYRSVYATNLEKLLRDYKVFHHTSTGSGENLELLASGKANLAFAQADVYAARLAAEPERFGGLVVIGKLADECIYLACRRQGPVTGLAQLGQPVRGRPAKVALGPETSGMQGTWRYLVGLKPELDAAEVKTGTDTLAINHLAVGAFDAVGWVTDPRNFEHNMLRAVLLNDAVALMELTDPALVTALPDGTQVYQQRTVKLAEGWRAPTLKTVCTSALIFAREDSDPKLIRKVADLVSLQLDTIVPHE